MKRSFNWILFLFVLVLSFSLYANKSNAQTQPDSFTLNLSGSALSSTTAINVTLSIAGGSAQLDTGASLMANGASQLLSDVNPTQNIVTVVWTGSITDGMATITGMLKPGSVTGNPSISVTKIEAAGGKDITSTIATNALVSSPQPSPSPSPSPKPSPSPSPSPSPLPSPTPVVEDNNAPKVSLSGPDTINLKARGLNIVKLTAKATNFTGPTRCDVSSSDDLLAKVRPDKFILNSEQKRNIFVKVPFSAAKQLINDQSSDVAVISITCKNEAEDDFDILIDAEPQ